MTGVDTPLRDRRAVAQRLSIAPRTVTDLVARRELECIRVGRQLRFTDAAIAAYLDRQRQPARATSAPASLAPVTPAAALPVIRVRRFA